MLEEMTPLEFEAGDNAEGEVGVGGVEVGVRL